MTGRALRIARRISQEAAGSLGDLGTFVPHVLGAITIAGLSACSVLAGFGLLYVVTGLVYRAPVPVQPMKAVSAVLLTSGLEARQLAASGVALGAALLLLTFTGALETLARVIPRSVVTGLQLGLGLALGMLAFDMLAAHPLPALAVLGALALLLRIPGCPAALLVLAAAIAAGQWWGLAPALPALTLTPQLPVPVVPDFTPPLHVFGDAVAPQLALTVTNAIIVTAALGTDLLGPRARRIDIRRLALTTGTANLLLAPLGALPMCHGAGGLAAHHRFGARSGAGIACLGVVLLAAGLLAAPAATALLMAVPTVVVGALLAVSAFELAWSRRLLEARPACLPVIGVTAAAALLVNPLAGLVCGWVLEAVATRVAQRAS